MSKQNKDRDKSVEKKTIFSDTVYVHHRNCRSFTLFCT